MKVILIKDVTRLGRKSDVTDVPAGHAQNFLIPRGLAIPATPENMKRVGEMTKKLSEETAAIAKSFTEACDVLKGKTITYEAQASEQGHLFKGINAHDIAKRLTEEGAPIPEESIVLDHPLKSIGVHEVRLELGEARGSVTLEVKQK